MFLRADTITGVPVVFKQTNKQTKIPTLTHKDENLEKIENSCTLSLLDFCSSKVVSLCVYGK